MDDDAEVKVRVVRVDALDMKAYAECAMWVDEAHEALEAYRMVLLIPPKRPGWCFRCGKQTPLSGQLCSECFDRDMKP